MSSPDQTQARLAQLEASAESGCLTITSPTGGECRIYLLGGRILLVDGPKGRGDGARAWTRDRT